MPNAGYLASNVAKNVRIAHGVGAFFKRDGTTTWVDLGDIGDLSMTPIAEFLEHFSNRKGQNALSKRLLTQRGLTIDLTLNEVNPDNIRFALFGGAVASGSINVLETATPTVTAANTLVLGESADEIVSVVSNDGLTTYAVTSDYTFTGPSATITIVASGALDTDTTTGDEVMVTYYIYLDGSTDNTDKSELLDSTDVKGALQFRVRNNKGGLAQIYELDSVNISPNGSISLAADEIQTLPVTLTANEVNGKFGRVYMASIANA